jgi:small subunit ribosomal protein S20
MPNLKSAKKRMRQAERSRVHNLGVKTRVKTARKSFLEAVETGQADDTDAAFRTYCSVLDKAVKANVIKKNTAVRRKGRASDKLRALQSTEA